MTLPDLAGRTALLQRTMPNPRAKVIIEGNLLAAEARKHAELGNKVMGKRKWTKRTLEETSKDYWEEMENQWIRKRLAHVTGTISSSSRSRRTRSI